jgi:hypothetical protein
MFYAMRWIKQDFTCIYFKEFLNQLNLFYIFTYIYTYNRSKVTGGLVLPTVPLATSRSGKGTRFKHCTCTILTIDILILL